VRRRSTCALLAAGTVTAVTLVSAVTLAAQRGPAPVALHMDPEVLALACAPSVVDEPPLAALQVTGAQESFIRRVFAPGDLVTINAGTDNGIEVGQEFYTRRILRESRQSVSRKTPGVVRTTGWVKVYAVDKKMSLVTITHACESVDVGDYLEPLVLPTPVVAAEKVPAQKTNYGRILIGADRRRSFAKGDFMVVDRGSDHGVSVGARFVVYRDKLLKQNFLYDLGEAVAVDVRPETSTLQVIVSRDAFKDGDYVALRK
jgi:hypothetical protein